MDCIEADPPCFTPGARLSSDARLHFASRAGPGTGQDQCSPLGAGSGTNETESAERAEEWRGAAAQKSRPPAKLLRAAFSEHHPAKPSLVQWRKRTVLLFRVANPQLLLATAPHPPGQKKAFLQTCSARMSVSKHAEHISLH